MQNLRQHPLGYRTVILAMQSNSHEGGEPVRANVPPRLITSLAGLT
jgi:hypothetical protein